MPEKAFIPEKEEVLKERKPGERKPKSWTVAMTIQGLGKVSETHYSQSAAIEAIKETKIKFPGRVLRAKLIEGY